MVELVRLKRVPLTKIFKSQEKDLIPWLVQVNTLQILSESVGMNLSMDIISGNNNKNLPDLFCKNLKAKGNEAGVLIECQFGQSDENYLTKFLKNLSVLNSSSVIWIAEKFTDEHKAILDWLNIFGAGKVTFFALEIELFKIGVSDIAANFNIISRPINWQIDKVQEKTVYKKAKVLGRSGRKPVPVNEKGLTPIKQMQLNYWKGFGDYQKKMNAIVQVNSPRPLAYLVYSAGTAQIIVKTQCSHLSKTLFAEFNFWSTKSAAYYYILQLEKEVIDKEIGLPLIWMDMEGKQGSKLRIQKIGMDIHNKSEWEAHYEWFSKALDGLFRVIKPRLSKINPDDWINRK